METISDAQIVKDFEEKFLGYYRCARAAAPYMKQAGWGRIVNLSGGAGRTPGTGISTPARNICLRRAYQVAGQYARSLWNQCERDLSRHDHDRSGLGSASVSRRNVGKNKLSKLIWTSYASAA